MDATTNKSETTKQTTLTAIKATPTVILVETTVAIEATIRNTDMETTTAIAAQTTDQIRTIVMATTTEMARTGTTRATKSANDNSTIMKTIILKTTTRIQMTSVLPTKHITLTPIMNKTMKATMTTKYILLIKTTVCRLESSPSCITTETLTTVNTRQTTMRFLPWNPFQTTTPTKTAYLPWNPFHSTHPANSWLPKQLSM